MKKYLLFGFFAVSALSLSSQVNTVVTDTDSYFGNNSCWTYYARLYTWIGFDNTSCIFTLNEDTLINNIYYKKYENWLWDRLSAVRQENQKIYVFDNYMQMEYLLYDFGVNEGDTIYTNAQSGYLSRGMFGMPAIVGEVDSITLYSGERKKRIMVGSDTWIEGIGSINGFEFPITDFVTCDCNSTFQLIAFAKNDTVSFFDPVLTARWGYCGSVILPPSAQQNIKINEEFMEVIQKNNNIQIIGESSNFPCDLKLFSITGQLILEKKLQSSNEIIPVNQKGIFLFQIQNDKEILKTGKITVK